MTADISAADKSDIRNGLALEASVTDVPLNTWGYTERTLNKALFK